MKNQGVVKFFAIALALVCLFHLSFTIKSRLIESKADQVANGNDSIKRRYLDSLSGSGEKVYNLLIKKYTYLQVKERELNLGLDLQGGMNVTLEVSVAEVIKALSNYNTDPKFNQAIQNAVAKQVNSQSDFVTLFLQAMKETAPGVKLSTFFANKNNSNNITFNSSDREVENFLRSESESAVERTFSILTSRIDRFGVSQPNIQKLEGSGRIMVELPGVDNPEKARKLLQASAKLEFWETYSPAEAANFMNEANKSIAGLNKLTNDITLGDSSRPALIGSGENTLADSSAVSKDTSSDKGILGSVKPDSATGSDSTKTPEEIKKENPIFSILQYSYNSENNQFSEGAAIGLVDAKDTAELDVYLNHPKVKEMIPSDVVFMYDYKAIDEGGRVFGLYALKASKDGRSSLEGDVVIDARSQIGNNGFEVDMTMNADGASAWKKMTAKAASADPKKCIAIVLDGVVYSAPRVTNEIPGGRSQITGNFKQEDTKFLANILKSGKLPAPARIVEEAIVGPTLGKEAISSGLTSIIAGFFCVLAIMAIIYNTAGWVTNIAVLLNLFFTIGVLASLQAALTLPGIAGIILSLGMAVDANVLINERIKEELESGKNLRNAIAGGYVNALSAILDSNITTLITGFVLLAFGTGPIYGFAVTLIIGILISLFTGILITRLIFEWVVKKEKNIKFSFPFSQTLLRGTNFNFMGNRKYFYSISSILIIAGLVSIFTKGLDYGVDFKGGWSYVISFENDVQAATIKSQLEPVLEGAPEVKIFGSDKNIKLTTDYNIADNSENASDKVLEKIASGLAPLNNPYKIQSANKVGPTVADDLKAKALWAVGMAVCGMFLYILIRFKKWQFATGTVIKLLHDVLIVVGLFSLLDGIVPFTMEIDQSFIAAILTVIGYSINDSVVVMDRVREYMAETKGNRGIKQIINKALNDTLSRTMITSLATIGVLMILFIFGGEVIRGFSFAMLIGVLIGSYSSLCIGAPVAADLVKEDAEIA